MATFTILAGNQARAKQLIEEIRLATGIDLGAGPFAHMTFHPPNVVFIPDEYAGDQAAAIQAVCDAHSPDPMYFQDDRDVAVAYGDWQALREMWQLELDWLNTAIPLIDSADLEQLRTVLKRLAQENLCILRAFALLFQQFK